MSRYVKHACHLPLLILVFAFVFITTAAQSQQNPKRLILKDGSYQTVTKWEVHGDRVRYFSAERYAWEDLPNELVDWPATDKYNQEHEKQREDAATQVAQQEKAERQAVDAATPIVGPGLRLPDTGGVYLLDVFLNQVQLVELTQNGGDVNKQTGRNILRAALNPLSLSSKQTIEINGLHAAVQAHYFQPAIFLDVDTTDDESSTVTKRPPPQPNHYRRGRLEPKKDSRVVGHLSVPTLGKVSQKEDFVPTRNSMVGEWVKVEPEVALQPGEYALVEMLDDKQINIYVWDFGINPQAPQNARAIGAKPPAQGQAGNTGPGLTKKPD
jgi:hypothetical protein